MSTENWVFPSESSIWPLSSKSLEVLFLMLDAPNPPVPSASWWEWREESSVFTKLQRVHCIWGREHCHLEEKYVNTKALPCSHFVFWINSSLLWCEKPAANLAFAPGCLCICFLSLFEQVLPLWLPLSCDVCVICCRDWLHIKRNGVSCWQLTARKYPSLGVIFKFCWKKWWKNVVAYFLPLLSWYFFYLLMITGKLGMSFKFIFYASCE